MSNAFPKLHQNLSYQTKPVYLRTIWQRSSYKTKNGFAFKLYSQASHFEYHECENVIYKGELGGLYGRFHKPKRPKILSLAIALFTIPVHKNIHIHNILLERTRPFKFTRTKYVISRRGKEQNRAKFTIRDHFYSLTGSIKFFGNFGHQGPFLVKK